MSHTLDHESDESAGSVLQHQQLSQMMKQGRSWSGHERNCCFLNLGGRGDFATISALSGLDFADDARAQVQMDWDGDGDLDLWISNRNAPRLRLMRNDASGENRSIAIRLAAPGSRANQDAIGARVELTPPGATSRLIKTLKAGEGFLSQSGKWLHFGLGPAEGVADVTVRWPGGVAERFEGVEVGHSYRLVQGTGRSELWQRPGGVVELEAGEQEVPEPSSVARIPMVTLLPVPALSYSAFDGTSKVLPVGQGKPVVINLWASWCQPCVVELKELGLRRKELEAAGVVVLALSVDGLGDDKGNPAKAAALLERLRFPFAAGRANEALVGLLQHLHDTLTPMSRPLPVPSSFLIDGSGRLSVLYKGPVRPEALLDDLAHSGRTRSERFVHSTSVSGRVIDHPLIDASRDSAETKIRFQFAQDLAEGGRLDDAVVQYQEVIQLLPAFAEAHNNLGLLYSKLGKTAEALTHLQRAVGIRPGLAEGFYNLGSVHEKRGDLNQAIAHYRKALEVHPHYPRAHNAVGILLARLKRPDEAMVEFQEEIRLFPEFAEAYNNLGLVHLERGETLSALEQFTTAVGLDGAYPDAENNLGIAYRRLERNDQARLHYERAVRLQPEFVEARNNLGLVLMREGLLKEAKAEFEQALRARPDFAPARRNLEQVNLLMSGSRP